MDKDTAKEYILQRFVDNIGGTDFTFSNENYVPTTGTEWILLEVLEISSYQETLGTAGNRKYERAGTIRARIYTPLNEGTSLSNSLALTVRTIFEGVSFNGVRCYDAVSRDTSPDPKNAWFQQVVEIYFEHTDIK